MCEIYSLFSQNICDLKEVVLDGVIEISFETVWASVSLALTLALMARATNSPQVQLLCNCDMFNKVEMVDKVYWEKVDKGKGYQHPSGPAPLSL